MKVKMDDTPEVSSVTKKKADYNVRVKITFLTAWAIAADKTA
jgi:hypothetical protein